MRKKLAMALSVFVLFTMIMMPFVSAHEFLKPLRWSIKSGTLYATRVSRDMLNSSSCFYNYVPTAVSNWSSSPTQATSQLTSFSSSNVDFWSVSQEKWNEKGLDSSFIAITWLTDTNSYTFKEYNDSYNSTGQISYAAIWVNPQEFASGQGVELVTCMHEVGHVYGLWHSGYFDNSIMNPGLNSSSPTTLQQHDISDMASFYGAWN